MTHGNRSKLNRSEWANPTPNEIRRLLEENELTMEKAAKMTKTTTTKMEMWLSGKQRMHPGLWELLLMKVNK